MCSGEEPVPRWICIWKRRHPFEPSTLDRGWKNERGRGTRGSPLVFTRRKYLVTRGLPTFILIPPSWPCLVARVSRHPRWRPSDGRSLRKSRSRRFFGGIGSQKFQIYRPIYGGGSRAALIASGKFGPRDVASRFLPSIFEPAPAAATCRGSHRLKVRIVVRLDFTSKISLPSFFRPFSPSLSLFSSRRLLLTLPARSFVARALDNGKVG